MIVIKIIKKRWALHLKFCKYILGLNKKSVNHASLSERGRHPLHYVLMGEYTTMSTNSLSEHHSAALLYITCPCISSLISCRDCTIFRQRMCRLGYKNYKGETLHLKFCKYILGLNKKSVNHASLSELGRHPLHYDIVNSLLKYCYRLENLTTEFPLLKDAFFSKLRKSFRNLKKTFNAFLYNSFLAQWEGSRGCKINTQIFIIWYTF
jgi:hypothetical protein